MGNGKDLWLLVVAVAMCYAVATVGGYEGGEGRTEGGEGMFLLQEMRRVVKTEAGDMKVVKGFGGRIMERPMRVGFISMEPKSLFIPQYLDSHLIIFVRTGEVRVGSIHKDDLVERRLKAGDVYRIEAGSAFYLVNTNEGQKLHIICSIDKSESMGWGTFQSFFLGGGTYPASVLSGFNPHTLSSACNVSISELGEIMTRQKSGPIVFYSDSEAEQDQPSVWTQFLQSGRHERLHHLKRMVQFHEGATKEEDEPIWSIRKILNSVFGKELINEKDNKRSKSPHSYNLYDKKPNFRNRYGWTIALDESDYSPLGHSGIGLYLVNLSAGSMLAPHINPTATEYGVVLRGAGRIEIVYPNGSLAMNARVKEGDVFWVPQYFPFCQIASRTSPFEFFGFTTSARKNRPQFLVGSNSILKSMRGPEFAAAFGVSEKRLGRIIDAQREGVILPSASAAPPDEVFQAVEEEEKERPEKLPAMIRGFGEEMVMGFD